MVLLLQDPLHTLGGVALAGNSRWWEAWCWVALPVFINFHSQALLVGFLMVGMATGGRGTATPANAYDKLVL
jgi:hypothetical protein